MSKIAMICIAVVGLLHVMILYVEMFNWPLMANRLLADDIAAANGAGFDLVAATTVMAQNQGLYNGFLAAGLFWSLIITNAAWKRHIATFFLLCVAVAGVYGWLTTGSIVILVAQTVLALIALAALHFGKSPE